MRDDGLSEAIRAVGGVSELARRIGISQPSVSNWERVPTDRILAVEAATGVSRAVLRPDLFEGQMTTATSEGTDAGAAMHEIDDVDRARAQEYALLAMLLARTPNRSLLDRLASVVLDASPLGAAHAALGEAAREADVTRVEREYFDLFIGVGRGELLPYASYYLTGFLHERPLARLREDLGRFGIARADNVHEPEDHIASLCEVWAGLIAGRFPAPHGADEELFTRHLAPWAARFFADLEHAEAADFYRRVGALGRVFMDIEVQAFALPA